MILVTAFHSEELCPYGAIRTSWFHFATDPLPRWGKHSPPTRVSSRALPSPHFPVESFAGGLFLALVVWPVVLLVKYLDLTSSGGAATCQDIVLLPSVVFRRICRASGDTCPVTGHPRGPRTGGSGGRCGPVGPPAFSTGSAIPHK